MKKKKYTSSYRKKFPLVLHGRFYNTAANQTKIQFLTHSLSTITSNLKHEKHLANYRQIHKFNDINHIVCSINPEWIWCNVIQVHQILPNHLAQFEKPHRHPCVQTHVVLTTEHRSRRSYRGLKSRKTSNGTWWSNLWVQLPNHDPFGPHDRQSQLCR